MAVVFGSCSDWSLPPLIGAGGGLVCESIGKADRLSAHFDGKQSRDPVDLPSTSGHGSDLKLLLDLDSYGGTDP